MVSLRTAMQSRVGKYDIVDEIGHGGMATVYRARDTVLHRFVALKVMHPHLQGAKEARVRFAREAVTIARLRHPSILEIYDYSGEDSDISYLAAELLTGPTLKAFAEQTPDIPAELAACLVIPVARALSAAHKEGVIHRDVKPENVMLHEGRAVKLTDFGIAQLVDAQSMTTTGQVLGSPAHMAPEQIEGRECDARSDIFSLGTVLYLLATGELPFQGRNPHQVLKQIADGYYREPQQIKPQIGARMAGILRRCLRLSPAERYPDAQALEQDLLAFVAEAGIDDPDKELVAYLESPAAFTAEFNKRIIETQIALGARHQAAGDPLRAMDAWNRVLALDERNARVLAVVQRAGRRQRLKKIVLGASAAIASALLVGFVLFELTGPKHDPSSILDQRTDGRNALRARETASAAQTATPARPKPAASAAPAARDRRDEDSIIDERRRERRAQALGQAAKLSNTPRTVVFDPDPANVSISVDGAAPRAFGPSFRALDLAPGDHKLKFMGAHECCIDEEIVVKIPPGPGTTVVTHKLTFRPAGLYVVSNTPANVVVDEGEVSGRTRSVIQVPQPNAMYETHTVRISADGHEDIVREVRLRAGQVETIEVQLGRAKTTPASR